MRPEMNSGGHVRDSKSQMQDLEGAHTAEDEPPRGMAPIQAASSTDPVHSVFGKHQKLFIVITASVAGFFSPVSANTYFPALNSLARDLNVSNTLINLTLTSYMLFQGLAPAFIGDFADVAGRRPAYTVCFAIYIAANVGLALQNSFAALFVLRCLQSSGSSGTIALSSGVVADVATASERGKWVGWVSAGFLLGPSIGPVIGGLLAQYLGWRAIFWFLVIFAAAFFVPFLIFFPETGRNIVGNGSIPPTGWNMSLINCLQLRKQRRPPTCTLTSTQSKTDLPARKLRFPNPLSSIHILLDKEISLLLFHTGFFFAAFYSITASLPSLLASIYHFNDLYIGLCYLPFGAGCILAALCNGQLLDRNFRRFAKKLNFPIKKGRQSDLKDFPIEKARLQVAIPMAYLSCVFMLLYGWLLEINGPLPVVLVLLFFTSLTMMVAFNVSATLLVDFYPKASATATAANNLVRCLLGAGATAVVNPMIDAMGRGWCFTFLSLFLVAASPMVWCVYLWGQGWREERRVREGKYEYQCDGDGRRGEDLEEAKPPVGGPRSEIGAAEKGVQERRDVSAVKHEPRCLRSPSRDV